MRQRIKNIFGNRYLQSILFGAFITLIVAVVWDVPVERFELSPAGEVLNSTADELLWFYDDFDNDGNTDKLRCFNSSFGGRFTVVSFNHQHQITSAMHFENDFWTKNLIPAIADVNNDGIKDFLFFSIIRDSIFFTAADVVNDKILIDHMFFMQVERYSEKMAIQSEFYPESISMLEFKGELLFYFDAGYGLYPRGVFKLNLNPVEFVVPEKTYSPFEVAQFQDINNDGKKEILLNTYAPSNVAFETIFSDNQSYIAAYDTLLTFLFPPIPVKKEYSSVKCIAGISDTLFYTLIFSGVEREIAVVSSTGIKLTSKILPPMNYELNGTVLKIINNKPHLIISNYGYFALTPDLRYIPDDRIPKTQNNLQYFLDVIDLDRDGYDEIISLDVDQSILIYNTRHNHLSSTELHININFDPKIVPQLSGDGMNDFLFLAGSSYFSFSYLKNPWYFVIYLMYFGLFIFFSGVINLLLYLQQRRLEGKWNLEKQLSELQFNAVKNQLHPHFMFNALNSVAQLINSGQHDEAYDFLTINSRMIQQVMNDAKEVKRSLKAEIRFTHDYLAIQKQRFKDKFTVEFDIHPDCDLDFNVPKMCIHTYVENAVKHGFRKTRSGGMLKIEVNPLSSGVHIAVCDNGMGRMEASKSKSNSGQGIKIMEEFYRLFERYHRYSISYRYIDLKPEIHGHSGLRTELEILHDSWSQM